MLLRRIVIENFGVYGGRNEFDFTPEPGRPIILCGGTNGAGKTTLFESVALCLYGHVAMDEIGMERHYRQKILKSFHRYLGTRKAAEEAAITVEFQYAHDGRIMEYQVRRMWQNNNGSADETLTIGRKDYGEEKFVEQDELDETERQILINQLLPIGTTRLFFFNGEKIQGMADSGREDEYIKSSFNSLLGLDLVQQLHKDMGLYILRGSGRETKKIMREIEEKTKEKLEAEDKLEDARERQVAVQAEINGLQRRVLAIEEQFQRLGGQFARRRESLTRKTALLESSIEEVGKEMRDICSDLLPLLLVEKQIGRVRDGMASDIEKTREMFARDVLKTNFRKVILKIRTGDVFTASDEPTRRGIARHLKNAFDEILESLPGKSGTVFNFSIGDMGAIIRDIDAIDNLPEKRMATLAGTHRTMLDSLKKSRALLDVAPKDDEIGPVFSDIVQLNREIGALESDLSRLRDIEAQEKSLIILLNSKIRQNLTKKKIGDKQLAGLKLAPKVQDALEEYARLLSGKKIEQLEANILDKIKRLFHKKNFIEKVSIDGETFMICLYRENGEEITKDMLSPGELQMYATAIMWGLAKTSDRPLPFIIDTPLARLDAEHRKNIVEDFYPDASHQVIIFSTDSEVVGRYYDELKPHISKTMVINYDSSTGRTERRDGYFEECGTVEASQR